jgi:hypothetical protein
MVALVVQANAGDAGTRRELERRAASLAKDPDIDEDTLLELARLRDSSNGSKLHQAVATHPLASPAVLIALAKSSHPFVAQFIADRSDAPAEALDFLARHTPNTVALMRVAEHSNTSPDALVMLARSVNPYIRGLAASNEHLPVDVWEGLLHDADDSVRACAAHNPRTGEATLDALADDWSAIVRAQVAYDRRTPTEVLDRLAQSTIYRIADLDRSRDDFQTRHRAERHVLQRVVENPGASVEILKQLGEGGFIGFEVESGVASNPNTPPELLRKYATGYLYPVGNETFMTRAPRAVLVALASNPQLPEDCIELLSQHAESEVREAVALATRR